MAVTNTQIKIPKGYRQTDVGVIPGDWDVKLLGECANIVSGGTPSTSVSEYWNGKINWCTPTDITGTHGKYLYVTERTISEKGLKYSSANILPAGCLLLCSRATIGEIRISKIPITTNQGFKSLVPFDNINNEFLYYKVLTLKNSFIEKAIGSTFLEISKKDTFSIKVTVPKNKPEQTAIATALSDIDSLIEKLEKLIEKKNNIKQGAMQALLTGKKRLPGFKGEWVTIKLGELFSISAGQDLIKSAFSLIKDYKHPYPVYSNSVTDKGLYGYSEISRHGKDCITVTARGTLGAANERNHGFDAIGRLLILRPLLDLNCFFYTEYINSQCCLN